MMLKQDASQQKDKEQQEDESLPLPSIKNEELPEVLVEPPEGEMISALRLNLTPDSYNSLVKIMSVLTPEST